jgi:hypothetical protein
MMCYEGRLEHGRQLRRDPRMSTVSLTVMRKSGAALRVFYQGRILNRDGSRLVVKLLM